MIILRPLATRLFTKSSRLTAAVLLAVSLSLVLIVSSPSTVLGQSPAETPSEEPKPAESSEDKKADTEEPAVKPAEEAKDTEKEKPAEEDKATEEKAPEEEKAKEAGPITALVHGRVLTMADAGEITDGTILIQDGKIKAVGSELEIPEGARVVDVTGMIVTPGFVDLRSRLWMTSLAANDTGSTAVLDALDGVDPYSSDWKEVARQGITAVYVQPSARGSLGGYGALLRVAEGGDDFEKLVLVKHAGFQSSLGVGTAGSSTRAKVSEFSGLKKRFADAKEYAEQWKKYREYEEAQAKKKSEEKKADPSKDAGKEGAEKKPGEAEAAEASGGAAGMRRGAGGARPGFPGGRPMPPGVGGQNIESRPAEGDKPNEQKDGDKPEAAKDGEAKAGESKDAEKPPKKPEQDPIKDRLVEILEGKVTLRLEVHGLEDAKRALEFAKEFGITIVLEGLSDLATSKESVVDSSLPVILGPWLDAERESYQSKDRVELWEECFSDYAGRLVIGSFARSARGSKQLRYHAAAAVAAGFDTEKVLEAITANAALLAGAGESHGKIEEGFAADLAVFAGHPLDPAAPVAMTFSAGEITHQAAEMPAVIEVDSLARELEFPGNLPGEYVIKSQRILSAEGQFKPGLLHVSEGMVKAILPIDGEVVGVRTIDVGNGVVTPGLISAHTELSLAALIDRQGLADSGPIRAADVYDALLPSVRRLVDGGFLRVASAPASDRVIAGQAAELRLLAKEPIINAELAEKVVLSEAARSRERFPSSLAGQQQLIRDALTGKVEPSSLYLPAAALAVLDEARAARQKSIVEGKRAVIMLVETDAEIAAATKLIRETAINGILASANQWDSAVALMNSLEEGAPRPGCIVRPMNSGDYDWYAEDLARLAKTGSVLAFAGEDPLAIRKTAAAVVQAGMPIDVVLRSLTSDAAKLLGMSEGAGRLIPGTAADFVVWDGSPLNLSAQPVAIVIDGTLVDEKSK